MNLFDLIWLALFLAGGAFIGNRLFGEIGILTGAAAGFAALLLFSWLVGRWKPRLKSDT